MNTYQIYSWLTISAKPFYVSIFQIVLWVEDFAYLFLKPPLFNFVKLLKPLHEACMIVIKKQPYVLAIFICYLCLWYFICIYLCYLHIGDTDKYNTIELIKSFIQNIAVHLNYFCTPLNHHVYKKSVKLCKKIKMVYLAGDSWTPARTWR